MLNICLLKIIRKLVASKITKLQVTHTVWINAVYKNTSHDKQATSQLWSRSRTQLICENYTVLRAVSRGVYGAAVAGYNFHLREVLAGAGEPREWESALNI